MAMILKHRCKCGLVTTIPEDKQEPGTEIECMCGERYVFPTPEEWARWETRLLD